ncbi:polysaccharide deacetylase family protein [Streptomyces albipurpureus]|uniref:Polysaccharide deacetylase family protein n=1 Tax=Streptomyces albipurpureus TaxID=2897419 RepID=A0ABT0UZ20_9ACTN|nr:polysaccharide deacetylase family protein [Streptomyces sp. CWNU-1]MCM2393350.1 polysaccharide deacetylase family protein [Streptomyces sp. CWNU-1]
MPITGKRATAAAAVAALTLTLVGCSMDTTAPADARSDARSDGRSLKNPTGTVQASTVTPDTPVDCEKAKCIALTFDAGPGKDTPRLLDTLLKERVPATFFLLGKNHVVRYPGVVKRISAEGHEVANHTWTHRRLDQLNRAEIHEELSRTQEAIARITGREPTLMRPPQGRIDDEVTEVSKELGLAQILWSATAKDYSTNDSALIEKRILKQAGRDGIILLHDIYDGTVPAVPGIIEQLKDRGYTFVTVSQLLAPAQANPGEVYRP